MVEEIKQIIEDWRPKSEMLNREPHEYHVLRALLNMHACILEQRRALKGEPTIRPLSDFPGYEGK